MKMGEKVILFAGGGTGGHLYPGVAVAQAMRDVMPDARPLFLCTTREIDRIILEPTGFEFIPQPIVPPVRTITGLLRFWRAWRETKDLVRKILRDRRPAAVLGLGGYAAGVAVKRGALAGLPAAVINPDVIPGKANNYLMKHARAVCCQFEATRDHVRAEHHAKLRVTGCPIRSEFRELPERGAAAGRLGLDPLLRTLVVTGASQGAKSVNEGVLQALPDLRLQGWQVLHLAGREHSAGVVQAYRERKLSARVIDFTPDMADVWAVADLAIARSGASTCAELTACGVPSILMPYPFHKDLHQRANARVLADGGAAVLLEDAKEARENAARLIPIVETLLRDAGKRQAMSEAARKLGRPDAAAAVAGIMRELMGASGVEG